MIYYHCTIKNDSVVYEYCGYCRLCTELPISLEAMEKNIGSFLHTQLSFLGAYPWSGSIVNQSKKSFFCYFPPPMFYTTSLARSMIFFNQKRLYMALKITIGKERFCFLLLWRAQKRSVTDATAEEKNKWQADKRDKRDIIIVHFTILTKMMLLQHMILHWMHPERCKVS